MSEEREEERKRSGRKERAAAAGTEKDADADETKTTQSRETHPRPLLADVVEQRLHLRVEHVPQVSPLALVQRLPHARDHAQAHVQRVARLLADKLVRLAAA